MRLSDAIATGRVLIKKTDAGSYCKCAIGMANAAIEGDEMKNPQESYAAAFRRWPFLANRVISPFTGFEISMEWAISQWFIECENSFSGTNLDQLIDWVRSVEPAEENCETTETAATTPDHLPNSVVSL